MAIAAGIMISIGAYAYLIYGGLQGAILFSVALLCICALGMRLYTGKASLVVIEPSFFWYLMIILGLNLLTVWLSGLLFFDLGYREDAFLKAQEITAGIISNGFVTNIFKGIMCGILIYCAVTAKESIIIMMCVTVFILCGFRHSIADMFYYSYAGVSFKDFWKPEAAVIIGNFLGCVLIPLLKKGSDK